MTRLIKQRNLTDCMVCCIAMALRISYKEVRDKAIEIGIYDPKSGRGIRDEHKLLNELGLSKEWHWHGAGNECSVTDGDFQSKHKEHCLTESYFVRTAWGRPAILSVPSLNNEGGWHAIYYDGFKIFDPSRRKSYNDTPLEMLKPRELVIFRPNVHQVLRQRRAV